MSGVSHRLDVDPYIQPSMSQTTVVPRISEEKKYRRVIVESPYAGDVLRNEAYARAALKDCLLRGEAPFASHLLYTQPSVVDDHIPHERVLGIDAGLAWGAVADATVVYTDFGISAGMAYGIERANREGRPVEYRQLPAFAAAIGEKEPVKLEIGAQQINGYLLPEDVSPPSGDLSISKRR